MGGVHTIIPFPKLLCSRSRHGALVGAKGVALRFVLSRENMCVYIYTHKYIYMYIYIYIYI